MSKPLSEHDAALSLFVTGLRDAHAVEHQALALLDRQIGHLENYPEVETRLRAHRGETEQQIVRLDEILTGLGEKHSIVKDLAMTLSGNMAAAMHMIAPDEILKNSLANFAFENFEAASYKALLTIADVAGVDSAVPLLEATLAEELAMVQFCDESLPAIVRKYIGRRAAGETAGH